MAFQSRDDSLNFSINRRKSGISQDNIGKRFFFGNFFLENFIFLSDWKKEEERKELCYIELEGEEKFSNYALYFFPFIGFVGTEIQYIITRKNTFNPEAVGQ